MYIKLRFLCICFLVCFVSSSYADEEKQNNMTEIQVLIDVSGSMKQNDPKNLRIAALKLLISLLPDGGRAGVLLFAEKTEVLVKAEEVNEKWKQEALKKINKIHSRGLYTHIEDAIQNAAQQWFKSSEQHDRHLILLTDGMVDISKDIMQSAESRERILSEKIPLLQQANVKVMTIALSENADAELLDKLSFDTNGWSETAQTADQLQKVFFKMFKKVVPQESVPIKGNTFSVDGSIDEFSILIFKNKNAPASQLFAPDNSKLVSTTKKQNVTWLAEKNYDLVTVKKPKAGEWKVVADMDPDNQVMIVTDLKFQLDGVPNYMAANESFEANAFFTEKEQLVSSEDFLSLINISVEPDKGTASQLMKAVKDKAGLYHLKMGGNWQAGTHNIKFIVDGKTFQREIQKTIEVVDSPVTAEVDVNQMDRTVTIQLIADDKVIDTEMMTVQAIINQSTTKPKTIDLRKKNNRWELVVSTKAGEQQTINFSILAQAIQGGSISPVVMPITIDDSLFHTIEPEVIKVTEPVIDSVVKEEEIVDELIEEKEPVNWLMTSVIVIIINILLIVGGYFGFKWVKKRMLDQQAQLLDRLT